MIERFYVSSQRVTIYLSSFITILLMIPVKSEKFIIQMMVEIHSLSYWRDRNFHKVSQSINQVKISLVIIILHVTKLNQREL